MPMGLNAGVERDERRDAWLRAQGIEILRTAASSVMDDAGEVADTIIRIVSARISSPA